jgi:hypothetical protein
VDTGGWALRSSGAEVGEGLIDQYDHRNDHHRPAVSLSDPGKWMGPPTNQMSSQVNVKRLQRLLVVLESPQKEFTTFSRCGLVPTVNAILSSDISGFSMLCPKLGSACGSGHAGGEPFTAECGDVLLPTRRTSVCTVSVTTVGFRECRLLVTGHGRRFWSYVPSQHPHFPLLALPNIYR